VSDMSGCTRANALIRGFQIQLTQRKSLQPGTARRSCKKFIPSKFASMGLPKQLSRAKRRDRTNHDANDGFYNRLIPSDLVCFCQCGAVAGTSCLSWHKLRMMALSGESSKTFHVIINLLLMLEFVTKYPITFHVLKIKVSLAL
jgi:hypothetical protein